MGPYEIIAPIGKGGMGEVYRARDTRLGREVAVKVSAEQFSERFEREARAIAALNHPNICQLYDVGPNYLVMELVDGESPQGPLPVETALAHARQIAEALDAAHDRGIVHRDLKPANIKIKPDGTVKVLDFGLAKMGGTPTARTEDSPTLTIAATQAGMILGTAAYMSPEQARGKEVDRRADIWAFGVVLYEMVTGRRLFGGEDISEILASVIKDKPDLSAAPPEVRRLLAACLEKDPKQRLQAAGDYRLLLDKTAPSAPSRPSYTGWIAAAVLALVAIAVSFIHFREEPPRALKMSVLAPDKAAFQPTSLPAVSPYGRRIAFVATLDGRDQLWVRDLDSLAPRALNGTDGADEPFWSPDSRSVGFFADGKLKKIDVAGGPPTTLCDVTGTARGGTWSKDNVLVFGVNANGLFRVSAAGGTATLLAKPDSTAGEIDHRFPWFLPDGRHLLYTARNFAMEKYAIYSLDFNSTARKRIALAVSNVAYTAPGYLLFVHERTLQAQPFDAAKVQPTGDAFPVAEDIDLVSASQAQHQFSVSQNGVLAHSSGNGAVGYQLTWFDRAGQIAGNLGTPGFINWGAISPDGNTVAVDRRDDANGIFDIWLHDLTRQTASRFTFGPRTNDFPVWSPDGSHVAFFSTRDGVGHPFQKVTSGTGQDEILSPPVGDPPLGTRLDDWSSDGRYLILGTAGDPKTKYDEWVLPLFGDRKPSPYLHTEFNEQYARLSPNGQWLAYTSDESKRSEIYVQTFPTPGGKWQVSTSSGDHSVWSRDGKELYFVSSDGKMMAVDVKGSGAKFEAGVPKPLFDVRLPGGNAWFDVSRDGRFLIPVQPNRTANAPMTVVVNWTAALKK